MGDLYIFQSTKKNRNSLSYHGAHYSGRIFHESFYSASNPSSHRINFRCENREKLHCSGGISVERASLTLISMTLVVPEDTRPHWSFEIGQGVTQKLADQLTIDQGTDMPE